MPWCALRAGPPPNRQTSILHDWRGRAVFSQAGNRITYDQFDNLWHVVAESVYDGTNIDFEQFDPNAADPMAEEYMSLRARSEYQYDTRGRMFSSTQVGVDPANGAVQGGLTTKYRYDGDGRLIETAAPGGLIAVTGYDHAGRATSSATFSAGRVLLAETDSTLDADGDAILVVAKQRQADGSFRVSTTAQWYDSANRLTASADYGTNAGANFTRPADAPTDHNSSNFHLTSYQYDDGHRTTYVTDPGGIRTRQEFDALGRLIRQVQAYDSTANGGNATPDHNRITNYTYTGLNQILSTTTYNAAPGAPNAQEQTTSYIYGDGGLRADELGKVVYADGSFETYTYDNLGEAITRDDRDYVTHVYSYDNQGRVISDQALIPIDADDKSIVDATVQKLQTTYDVLGRPVLFTSEGSVRVDLEDDDSNAVTIWTWGVINQVERVYNGYGQVAIEYQSASGPVDHATTPKVQYIYEQPGNDSRLSQVIYPNGRVLYYGYDGTSLDDAIDRVDYIADGGKTGQKLETYQYLGVSQVVGTTLPEEQITQTMQFTAFGQVQSVTWTNAANQIQAGYRYGYDADGHLLWRDDLAADAANHSDYGEAYGYNALGYQQSYTRGTLDADGTIGEPIAEDSHRWTTDSQGNRYSGSGQSAYGPGNRQAWGRSDDYDTSGAVTRVALAYDQAVDLDYDAWGRVVQAIPMAEHPEGSADRAAARYGYDALGRRITLTYVGDDTPAVVSYYDGGNVIEERAGQTTAPAAQFVWSAAGANRLVLRDQCSADTLNPLWTPDEDQTGGLGRIYALNDAAGNVTAIVKAGVVRERYVYDLNGSAQTLNGDFGAYPTPAFSDYGWDWLYRGMRFQQMRGWTDPTRRIGPPLGLYEGLGGNWYDPSNGLFVQPDGTLYPHPSPQADAPARPRPTAGGYYYSQEQLDRSWLGTAWDVFWNPSDYGAVANVPMQGAFWGTVGFINGTVKVGALVALAAAVPLAGYAMLAGGAAYGLYDFSQRLETEPTLTDAVCFTLADLSGVTGVLKALRNDDDLDSYDRFELLGSSLAQLALCGTLLVNAPRAFGCEWATGAEADNSLVLAANRFWKRARRDAEIAMRYDEDLGSDTIYVGHHSDPEFMGGKHDQKLTEMEYWEHVELHNAMNEHLGGYADKVGNTMRLGSTNNAQMIQQNFSRPARLQALADFYNRTDVRARWVEPSRDFFAQHPQLKEY